MHNDYQLPGNEDLARALELFSHDEEDRALAMVEAVLVRDPSNPTAYRAKSMICAGVDRLDEAILLLEKAIELSRGSNGSHFLELGELLLRIDRFDEAHEILTTAVNLLQQGGEQYMLGIARLAVAVAALKSGHFSMARNRAAEVDGDVSYYYCDEVWSRDVLLARLAAIQPI